MTLLLEVWPTKAEEAPSRHEVRLTPLDTKIPRDLWAPRHCCLYSYFYCTYNFVVVKFPCKICKKAVANNHHAIQCDKFHSWIHIKCNKVKLSTYQYLQQCTYIYMSGTHFRIRKFFIRKWTSKTEISNPTCLSYNFKNTGFS